MGSLLWRYKARWKVWPALAGRALALEFEQPERLAADSTERLLRYELPGPTFEETFALVRICVLNSIAQSLCRMGQDRFYKLSLKPHVFAFVVRHRGHARARIRRPFTDAIR